MQAVDHFRNETLASESDKLRPAGFGTQSPEEQGLSRSCQQSFMNLHISSDQGHAPNTRAVDR